MIKRFDLYLNTQQTGLIKAADIALLEEQPKRGQITRLLFSHWAGQTHS